MQPWICARRLSGFITAPHSKTWHTWRTLDLPGWRLDRHFGTGGDDRAFFGAACQTDADAGPLVGNPLAPTEPLGCFDQHRPQTRLVQMGQSEVQRIGAGRRRQFVHERLAGKTFAVAARVRYEPWRSGESLRTNWQRTAGIRYGVLTAAAPELMLTKCHEVKRPLVQTGFDVDDRSRPEVRPGEFLFPRPAEHHGTLGGTGQPSRLDRTFAGVLASESAAEIGDHDAHPVARDPQRAGDFALVTERILRPGPNRHPVAIPFGQSHTRLQRRVLHVGHVVRCLQRAMSRVQLSGKRVAGTPPWARDHADNRRSPRWMETPPSPTGQFRRSRPARC
jgi:hypothetical protein